MPHQTPQSSGTLTEGCSVAGATASARTPDSPPDQSGVRAIWPQTHTDHLGRRWVWVPDYECYRHDEDPSGCTALSLPQTLADRRIAHRATLPVNVFEWVFAHTRATGLARQVLLTLAFDDDGDQPAAWPGYVHLWLHLDDEDLATAAGRVTGFSEGDLEPVADAVTELIALGELLLITTPVLSVPVPDDAPALPAGVDLSRSCPDVAYTLPAYQRWLVGHEVAW